MKRSAAAATLESPSPVSAITRWFALPKRCSTVFGRRAARSAAKSSLNTGSLAPHASSTGSVEIVRAGPRRQRAPPRTRWPGVERDVTHEVGDRHRDAADVGTAPEMHARSAADQSPAGQADGALDERRRAVTHEFEHRRRRGETDDAAAPIGPRAPRCRCCTGSCPSSCVDVIDGPPHRDGTTPVVRRARTAARSVIDVEHGDHVAQIGDPVGVAARRSPRAVAHAELVDRDHPVRYRRTGAGTSPRRIPTSDCRARTRSSRRVDRPAAATAESSTCQRCVPPSWLGTSRNRDHVGSRPHVCQSSAVGGSVPSRERASQRRPSSHQTISVKLVFRPDPMPMHSTRSPALIWSLTLAKRDRDRGRADVAVLRERERAPRSGSMPSRSQMQVGVDLADLVDDVPVHADFPVEVVAGVLPGRFGEVEPGDQQAVRVGLHPIEVADAQLVVLRSTASDATPPMSGARRGARPVRHEHGSGGTRTERQRCELVEHVGRFGASAAADGRSWSPG